ncbi:MAG: sodium:alanine symporter family protein [Verrucomicrobia bacterium]|nr:sodium:alanine symporter family protein [Verrucomicrobiota bacterium]
MIDKFFNHLDTLTDFIWTFPALWMIILLGVLFSVKSRFFQLRKFPAIIRMFNSYVGKKSEHQRGVHPLKTFFASMGGAIGIGNIVVICMAVQLGGPGAIFWVWIVGFLGMLLSYSEVYLGVKYRIKNEQGSYNGGPMYYLQKAFNAPWIPVAIALLLCVYGVEVFMFSQMTASISDNWGIDRYVVMLVMLVLVIWASLGGIRRVGEICSALIPLFVVIYGLVCLYVFAIHIAVIPSVFAMIFKSAFTGHAAVGGFAGATLLKSMGQGAARGSYSGDIGIGYSAVIHAETSIERPQNQACLAIFGIFLDTFVICSMSVLLILVTGVWQETIPAADLVQTALARYVPGMQYFMPVFIFLLAYSTLIAYLVVGIKCAAFISPRYGKGMYILYAIIVMVIFSFLDPKYALIAMTFAGGILLLFNLTGIFVLRKEIQFEVLS